MKGYLFPPGKHKRKHGPDGYSSHESYRDWLRDEFSFRCVYCLNREQWGRTTRAFEIDHFHAQAIAPLQAMRYDNLVYSCAACNNAKGNQELPNPAAVNISKCVRIDSNGKVVPLNDDGRRVIQILRLNSEENLRFRRCMRWILQLAWKFDRSLYRELMRFPDDLPDLQKLTPPHNTRSEGVAQSWFARRERGELPSTY